MLKRDNYSNTIENLSIEIDEQQKIDQINKDIENLIVSLNGSNQNIKDVSKSYD